MLGFEPGSSGRAAPVLSLELSLLSSHAPPQLLLDYVASVNVCALVRRVQIS